MVNRNAGAGTRVLIDQLLDGKRPPGYSNQPRSHNAVAAAVAQGRADWGIAIEPVAKLYGLAFLPIAPEDYDFLLVEKRRAAPGRAGLSGGAARRCGATENPRARNASRGRLIFAIDCQDAVSRFAAFAIVVSSAPATQAQLRGHGGPVRALAISPDGRTALSGSFDTAAIRWSLERNAAMQVLRFHNGAVNAVALLPDGRLVTSGEDARIAIWMPGAAQPARVLEGHTAPVVALAVSPDGRMLASASWDRTARLWSLDGGDVRVLEGHGDNVNGVAFTPDGRAVVTAGYDATLRIWPLTGGAAPAVVTLPPHSILSSSRPTARSRPAAPTARSISVHRTEPIGRGSKSHEMPLIAVAVSPDGRLIAAAGIRGSVAIVERPTRKLVRTLVGPGLPVWSAAFFPDSRTLLTGGTDRMIRRWDAVTGEPIGDTHHGRAEGPPRRLCRRSAAPRSTAPASHATR